MIGKLKGRIDSSAEDWLIVDVGGVGYLVHCPASTLRRIGDKDDSVELHIETVVREDLIRLYGFASATEKSWFNLLITVQGVGARVALAVLSTLSVAELGNAIAYGDKKSIARAPGIGPKVAQRLVTELKDKFPGLSGESAAFMEHQTSSDEQGKNPALLDAMAALTNLGYSQSQVGAALATVVKEQPDAKTVEQLVRLALKRLALNL